MTWNTHRNNLLLGKAKNFVVAFGAQQIFRLRCSLHSRLLQLVSLLDEKIHWALNCVSQAVSFKVGVMR